MQCAICENRCDIIENGSGTCGMYTNTGGKLVERYPDHYLVVIPSEIESMPMLHYHPGSKFLQICTIGCNFKCEGCVSWILTEAFGPVCPLGSTSAVNDTGKASPASIVEGATGAPLMKGALHRMAPDEIITRATAQECKGIMFCFNEPAVSLPTFVRVAALARQNGLLVGCATNGYLAEPSFRHLLRHIDFINIGIKGCTDETYTSLGAASAGPVFRNLKLCLDSGIATEIAAVYVKGREDEVMETARLAASVSKDIPFQVMRFMPLAGADLAGEPSVREAEALCDEIKKMLNYVYLFNSPGTSYLNTYCPECGRVVVHRGFNGPMCAHVSAYREDGVCECGFSLPFVGTSEKESGAQVLGYFGGYKTIHCLESIQTALAFLGERNPGVVAKVLQEILRTDFIETLYEKTKEVDSYLNTIDHYAKLALRTDEARELRTYTEEYLSIVVRGVAGAQRPSVYFSLGHPLIAIFGDKFECNLVEVAGGRCVNKDLERDDTPGITIPGETLRKCDPDIILITGAIAYPATDYCAFCESNGLGDMKAMKNGQVYSMHPYNTGGRPDWILGLVQMANIIHPEIFRFDIERIAKEFYEKFLGVKRASIKQRRSIAHPTVMGYTASRKIDS